MKTNFSGPEFIAIVGTLFLILTALNLAARFQRNLRKTRNSRLSASSQENTPLRRTPNIRVITVKKHESEEEFVEAS